LPKPDVAVQNALIVLVLMFFIVCFYKAAEASERIDYKLRQVEHQKALQEDADQEDKK
jgi:hypothetical protein